MGVRPLWRATLEDAALVRVWDTAMPVAASGATAYVLAALEEAHQRGAVTIAWSNNVPAPILEVADRPSSS